MHPIAVFWHLRRGQVSGRVSPNALLRRTQRLTEFSSPGNMDSPANLFAVDFASAVTVHSSYEHDWVARRGECSISQLILDLAPSVSVENGSRVEFPILVLDNMH